MLQVPQAKKFASMFSNKKGKTDQVPSTTKSLNGAQSFNARINEAPSSKDDSNESSTLESKKVQNAPARKNNNLQIPLAERMRPAALDVYLGQDSAVGRGSQLRKLLEADQVPSLILWGPPGCGKTSLVNVIGKMVKSAKLVKMSAVTAGVADVREIIKQAKNEVAMFKRRTILFLDEVHRFNKAQQDSFPPRCEAGNYRLYRSHHRESFLQPQCCSSIPLQGRHARQAPPHGGESYPGEGFEGGGYSDWCRPRSFYSRRRFGVSR